MSSTERASDIRLRIREEVRAAHHRRAAAMPSGEVHENREDDLVEALSVVLSERPIVMTLDEFVGQLGLDHPASEELARIKGELAGMKKYGEARRDEIDRLKAECEGLRRQLGAGNY